VFGKHGFPVGLSVAVKAEIFHPVDDVDVDLEGLHELVGGDEIKIGQ